MNKKALAELSAKGLFLSLKTYAQVFHRTKTLVRPLGILAKHIDVATDHIKRFMAEYLLWRKQVRPILYRHFCKSVSKGMRRTSDVSNARLPTVFFDAPPYAVAIHLLVIDRDK